MKSSTALLCNSEVEWKRMSNELFALGHSLHSSSCGFSKWDREDVPYFMGIFYNDGNLEIKNAGQ